MELTRECRALLRGGDGHGAVWHCRQRPHVLSTRDQWLCVCEAFGETSQPCERRSQMIQRRNIEPRSQETQ